MPLWIVRHALAGTKDRRHPDLDWSRALSRRGTAQAAALRAWFAMVDEPVRSVHTSPTVRCASTVLAVAADRGLPLQLEPALAVGDPEAAAARALALLAAGGAVLCTHGEVLPGLLAALVPGDGPGRGGAAVGRCAKGALWIIDGEPGARRATYVAPPP